MTPQDLGVRVPVDDNVWHNTKLLRVGIEMAVGNQFAVCYQGINRESDHPVSYESALIEGEIFQEDPSDYNKGITRDAVYDDGRVTLRVPDSRGWGLYRDFVVEPGASGLGIAGEFSGGIFGDKTQPKLDHKDSTYNILITNQGKQPITAAIYAHAGAKYHHILVARGDAVAPNGHFIALYKPNTNEPAFAVDGNGNLTHANGKKVGTAIIDGHEVLVLK